MNGDEMAAVIERALARIGDELNLVPGRRVYSAQISYSAGTAKRVERELPNRNPEARAFAVIVKNRDTLDGGDDTVAEFLLQERNLSKAQAHTLLQGGGGLYITPGAAYETAIPSTERRLIFDLKGTLKSDFSTDAAVTVRVYVFEMVRAHVGAERARGA